jgi:UDP-glucose 4-epimerase
VILASSGAIYGSNDRSSIRETHEPEPMSPYGISKFSSERYVLLWNDLYGMNNVVFRFSSVYGAGRKKTSVNLIVDKAIKQASYETGKIEFEEIIVTGNGSQTRDFSHVSDVAEAILMAVDGKFPKGIYNIGTGTSTSINQLISMVEGLLGQKLIVKYTEKSKGDPLRNDFNVEKAESCGFKAKIKLEDGLKQLIKDLTEPSRQKQ